MMTTLSFVLRLFALVLFIVAAFPLASRINLVSAGLACWVAAELVGGGLPA